MPYFPAPFDPQHRAGGKRINGRASEPGDDEAVHELAFELFRQVTTGRHDEVRLACHRRTVPSRPPPATGLGLQATASLSIAEIALETALFNQLDPFRLDPFVVMVEGAGEVGSCRVVEHIEQRQEFLRRIVQELPNCRHVLVTVPARRELWSDYDRHWGHHLRYDRRTLASELDAAGLRALKTSYFFHWLYLASLAFKFLGIAKNTEFAAIGETGLKAWLHRLLGQVTRLESRLMPGFVPGSSIICMTQCRPCSESP